MSNWLALAISIGAFAVAALSLVETRRSNRRAEQDRRRELRADLIVERVEADRNGIGNDVLFVTLRNVGRADAVALESTVRIWPAWYRHDGPARTIPAGESCTLFHELATGAVVRRPRTEDGQGGFVGEPEWAIPKNGQIELRFTDASGKRTEALSLVSQTD